MVAQIGLPAETRHPNEALQGRGTTSLTACAPARCGLDGHLAANNWRPRGVVAGFCVSRGLLRQALSDSYILFLQTAKVCKERTSSADV